MKCYGNISYWDHFLQMFSFYFLFTQPCREANISNIHDIIQALFLFFFFSGLHKPFERVSNYTEGYVYTTELHSQFMQNERKSLAYMLHELLV